MSYTFSSASCSLHATHLLQAWYGIPCMSLWKGTVYTQQKQGCLLKFNMYPWVWVFHACYHRKSHLDQRFSWLLWDYTQRGVKLKHLYEHVYHSRAAS